MAPSFYILTLMLKLSIKEKMMKGYCKIDYDRWEYAGKVFAVHSYTTDLESTAVRLTLQDVNTGEFHKVTVPKHSIEWIG